MSSFACVVIALAAGFTFGFLVKHLLTAAKLAEANARAKKADSLADLRIAEEKKRIEAEYAQQAVELENRLMRDPHREKELEILRQNNAKLNAELYKFETGLLKSNPDANRDVITELNAVRVERDQANMRYNLLKERYDKDKSRLNDIVTNLANMRSELNQAIAARDQANCRADEYKKRIENIQCAWYKDASERDARLDRANLDHAAELDRRRNQQFELLQQLRQASFAPEVKSRLCAALEAVSVPDMSLGAVYVKRDLRSNVYHHAAYCTDDLVLASTVFVQKAGFIPCICCTVAPAPDYDETVFRSSFGSRKYHRFECQHMLTSNPATHKPMPVTEALRLGLVPCKACRPPEEPQLKVFF